MIPVNCLLLYAFSSILFYQFTCRGKTDPTSLSFLTLEIFVFQLGRLFASKAEKTSWFPFQMDLINAKYNQGNAQSWLPIDGFRYSRVNRPHYKTAREEKWRQGAIFQIANWLALFWYAKTVTGCISSLHASRRIYFIESGTRFSAN